jgi:hypothetical protein
MLLLNIDGRDDEIVSMATQLAYLPSIRPGLGKV